MTTKNPWGLHSRIWKGVVINLSSAQRVPLPSKPRAIHEIEQSLRSAPHVGYNQTKVEECKLEIQEILGTLNAQGSSLDGDLEHAPHLAPDGPHGITRTSSVPPSPALSAP